MKRAIRDHSANSLRHKVCPLNHDQLNERKTMVFALVGQSPYIVAMNSMTCIIG